MGPVRKALVFLPLAIIAIGAATPHFEHIVVIVQENRTPDNLFQGLCAAPYGSTGSCSAKPGAGQYNIQLYNWLNKASKTGVTTPTALPLATKYDMSHTHAAFVTMCDRDPKTGVCKMDGAAAVKCTPNCPANTAYTYVDNSKGMVNPYLTLATEFGWANYMFQTNQGPSFPAHQFLFGGTSAPSTADDAAGIFAAENPTKSGNPVGDSAGCAAPAGITVQLIDSTGSEKETVYPCFERMTVVDFLPTTFTWKYYAANAGSIWTAPNAIKHICASSGEGGTCKGKEWVDNVDLNPADVLKDIAGCKLRSLSWVTPTGQNSDHAGVSDGGGPSWVSSIVNAIGTSTSCDSNTGYWNNTAIVLVWDDWGGFYDHEAPAILPEPQGDYQYGFRVPMIVVSAHTPRGYIDNQQHDFGSILRFIEQNFGIPEGAMNFADARSKDNLSEFFTGRSGAPGFKAIKAPKSADFFLHDKRTAADPDDDN